MYFVIALAFVSKKSDPTAQPCNMLGLVIDALFYADDATLLTKTTAERMDAVCNALRELPDTSVVMEIHTYI